MWPDRARGAGAFCGSGTFRGRRRLAGRGRARRRRRQLRRGRPGRGRRFGPGDGRLAQRKGVHAVRPLDDERLSAAAELAGPLADEGGQLVQLDDPVAVGIGTAFERLDQGLDQCAAAAAGFVGDRAAAAANHHHAVIFGQQFPHPISGDGRHRGQTGRLRGAATKTGMRVGAAGRGSLHRVQHQHQVARQRRQLRFELGRRQFARALGRARLAAGTEGQLPLGGQRGPAGKVDHRRIAQGHFAFEGFERLQDGRRTGLGIGERARDDGLELPGARRAQRRRQRTGIPGLNRRRTRRSLRRGADGQHVQLARRGRRIAGLCVPVALGRARRHHQGPAQAVAFGSLGLDDDLVVAARQAQSPLVACRGGRLIRIRRDGLRRPKRAPVDDQPQGGDRIFVGRGGAGLDAHFAGLPGDGTFGRGGDRDLGRQHVADHELAAVPGLLLVGQLERSVDVASGQQPANHIGAIQRLVELRGGIIGRHLRGALIDVPAHQGFAGERRRVVTFGRPGHPFVAGYEQRNDRQAGCQIPDFDDLIVARGEQVAKIGGRRQAPDVFAAVHQLHLNLGRLDVDHVGSAAGADGCP